MFFSLYYYFDIKKVCFVKNTCFNPIPKVDSAVVRFVKKANKYDVKNEEHFFKLVNNIDSSSLSYLLFIEYL